MAINCVHNGRPPTINEMLGAVKVVVPNEKAREGQSADAKATHEALEEVRGSIGKVDAKAATLIGDDAGKSVREIAGEETEKIVGGATDAYDTLKEIEEWIEKDEAGAVALVERVGELDESKANKSELDGYKKKQTPVGVPTTTTGDATSFVWKLEQDADGVIKQERRSIPQALPNTLGLVKLVNVYNDVSEANGRAVSSRAVGEAYKALSEKDAEIERRVKSLEENGSGSSVEVVEPNSSAKAGQAADAEAVYKNFRLKHDLKYVVSEVKTVPVWTFSLALDGEEFDTVDMTLQRSYVSDLGNDDEDWAGYSARGKYRCELLRSLGGISGTSTFRATIEGVPVTSMVYQGASTWEKPFTFSGMTLRGSPLTASGAYSSAKQVEVVTMIDKIALEGTVKEELRKLKEDSLPMVETTHAELLTLRNSSQLVPGMQYRITDYVATTKQSDTKSANHPFDIIVTADSEDKLNEVARAIRHDGDTYFANCKLEAWKIWYCLDNDTNRFGWATSSEKIDGVSVAGKGVIYRIIDDWDNDVPYDFKGILTKAYINGSWSSDYRYTFGGSADETVKATSTCYSNKMGVYIFSDKQKINQNTFSIDCHANSFDNNCSSNTFGSYCSFNTFGSDCYENSFESGCYNNYFGSGCSYNTFGSYCSSNTFESSCNRNYFDNNCQSNSFENGCHDNSFEGYCYENSFGSGCYYNYFDNNCQSNSFESGCYDNTFGSGCSYNTFGSGCFANAFGSDCYGNSFESGCYNNYFGTSCSYNTFGSGCYENTFGNDEGDVLDNYQYITFGNGCKEINLYCTASTSYAQPYKNVELKSGVTGEFDEYGYVIARKTITDDNVNQSFHTTYKPVGSMEVSV